MKGGNRRAGRASSVADVAPPSSGNSAAPRLPRGLPASAQTARLVMSIAADEIALAALHARCEAATAAVCDVCERAIQGEPAGSGLYFWTRDGEARWEEPALCARCSPAIGMSAHKRFTSEDEGGE